MTKLFVVYLHHQVKNNLKMLQENTIYKLKTVYKIYLLKNINYTWENQVIPFLNRSVHFVKCLFTCLGAFVNICQFTVWPGFISRLSLTSDIFLVQQPVYIRYVIAKLSKFVKISMHTSSDSFLHMILWKLKGLGTSFWATFFIKYFDQNLSFVILHKLAKLNYQAVFTFQVFSKMWFFHVLRLGIWYEVMT